MANVTRKKISVKTVKLSDQPTGFTFGGRYKGEIIGKPFSVVNEKTGEIEQRTMTQMVFEDPTTNERTSYVADAGLRNAIEQAMVKEGALIECVKLEKVKLTKGRTMNQYDLFELQS